MKIHSALRFIFLGVIILSMALLFAGCVNDPDFKLLQPSDYPEHESGAAALYLSQCGGCHAAPLPRIHTAKHWPGVVQRMEMRMNNKVVTPPNAEETAIILGYLQKHAGE